MNPTRANAGLFTATEDGLGAGFVFGIGRAVFDRPVLAVLFENVAEVLFLIIALGGREVIGDGHGDVGFVGRALTGMEEVNSHVAGGDALTLELIFDGLARLLLPGLAGCAKRQEQREYDEQDDCEAMASVAVHRLDFYPSLVAFTSDDWRGGEPHTNRE